MPLRNREYAPKDYMSPLTYAIQKSNFWVNVSFFFVVAIWLLQELAIRDAFPIDGHRRLHHVLDILGVMWGSFVTGYIFHWVVTHVPEKRKEYEGELDVERDLSMMMYYYQSFIVSLLKGLRYDPSIKGNIYAMIDTYDTPPFIEHMVSPREVTHYQAIDDPFQTHYEITFDAIVGTIEDIYDRRHFIDGELRDVISEMRVKIQWEWTVDDPHKQRIRDLARLNHQMSFIHEYVKHRVMEYKVISPFLMDEFNWSTYEQAWLEAEEFSREEKERLLEQERIMSEEEQGNSDLMGQ